MTLCLYVHSCVVVKNFREKVQVQLSDLLPFSQCTKLTAAIRFSHVLGNVLILRVLYYCCV